MKFKIDKTEFLSRWGERLPTFEKLATLAGAYARHVGDAINGHLYIHKKNAQRPLFKLYSIEY